jgi:hypothetical protein
MAVIARVILPALFVAPALAQDDPGQSRLLSVKTRLLFAHPTDSVVPETLRTSEIGRVALVVKMKNGRERVLLDGKPQEPFASIVPPEAMAAAQKLPEQQRALLRASEGAASRILRFTPDQQRVYYRAFDGKGYVIASDRGKSQTYTSIMDDMPVFSPNSKAIAFVAGKGGRYVVVLNDREIGAFDDVLVGSLLFSPAGERLAFCALKSGEWRVMCDSNSYRALEGVGGMTFSPDSRRLAYVAFSKTNRATVMVDGQAVGEYDAVGEQSLGFSPDSKRLVFAAVHPDRKWYVHAVGSETAKPFGPYEAIGEESGAPRFSRDGLRLVWTAQVGSSWQVFENGQPLKSASGGPLSGRDILAGTPRLSNDSKRLAVGVRRDRGWVVWCDGEESANFDSIEEDSLRFTRDSKRLGFVGRRQGMSVVSLNLKELMTCEDASTTRISGNDSTGTIAVAVKRARTPEELREARLKDRDCLHTYWTILVNGEPTYGPFHDAMPAALGVSWDGKRICMPAQTREGWAMYVNGERAMNGLPMWYRFHPEKHLLEMIRVEKAGYELVQEVLE